MAYPVFDLHCDTADCMAWPSLDPKFHRISGQTHYIAELPEGADEAGIASGPCALTLEKMGETPWAQCFACFVPDEFTPEDSIRFFRQVMAHLDEQIARNADSIVLARNAASIRPALASMGRVAIKTIENARMFAADPALVDAYAEEGVLMASLSWNAQGPLASGHDVEDAGLTRAGIEAVHRMERAHMILDVSHLNDTCFDDVVRIAKRPFVASHSNSRAVCGHPRNLTDAQFAEIRDRGGLVGLNYCPDFLIDEGAPTADDLCRHIEHWLDMGGEDVIALGSDFDGTDLPDCVSSAAMIPDLQNRFVERFGDQITEKLCAGNALNFFERWGR